MSRRRAIAAAAVAAAAALILSGCGALDQASQDLSGDIAIANAAQQLADDVKAMPGVEGVDYPFDSLKNTVGFTIAMRDAATSAQTQDALAAAERGLASPPLGTQTRDVTVSFGDGSIARFGAQNPSDDVVDYWWLLRGAIGPTRLIAGGQDERHPSGITALHPDVAQLAPAAAITPPDDAPSVTLPGFSSDSGMPAPAYLETLLSIDADLCLDGCYTEPGIALFWSSGVARFEVIRDPDALVPTARAVAASGLAATIDDSGGDDILEIGSVHVGGCAEVADLHASDRALAASLAERGVDAEPGLCAKTEGTR